MVRHDQKSRTHQASHDFEANRSDHVEIHTETAGEFGKKLTKCAAAIASTEQRHYIDIKIAGKFKPSGLS